MEQKILIFGISGMLGSMIFIELYSKGYNIYGTISSYKKLLNIDSDKIITCVNVTNLKKIKDIILNLKPNIIINTVAITSKNFPFFEKVKVNILFPRYLQKICFYNNIRLIHYSSDAVFPKSIKEKKETHFVFPSNSYGFTKWLGEVTDFPTILTLRTSMIGPEIESNNHLLEWFLTSQGEVNGYAQTIFSGLTTLEHSYVLEKYILPNPSLHGLYHLAGPPITKLELLKKIAFFYEKNILIKSVRSSPGHWLNAERFSQATGYYPPSWDFMLHKMKSHNNRYRGIYGS